MTAKEVIKKAVFDAHSVEAIKEKPKVIFLQDIDKTYWEFVLKHEFVDHGDVFYFRVTLFLVDEDHFEPIPLISTTNIGYRPNEMIEEFAKVMDRALAEYGV